MVRARGFGVPGLINERSLSDDENGASMNIESREPFISDVFNTIF